MEASASTLYDNENTFMKNWFPAVEEAMNFEAGKVFFATSNACKDQYRTPGILYCVYTYNL
jgi:hypothetical protein